MLRKIGCTVLSAFTLFSADALATNHNLAPNLTIEYDLPANNPQVFSNYFFWTITATCVIHTQDNSNTIIVKGLNKKGKINGTPLTEGQTMVLTIHDNDRLVISADSGAKVELTNQGAHSVKAVCST